MTCTALVFQNTTFDVTDRNGQPWIRGYQIGTALGYTNQPDAAVRKIYDRNADEFTASMTAVVKLPTAGGEQETRIFSLRGCHLLAMLSRTKIAKTFRVWVLDILDKETGQSEAKLKQGANADAERLMNCVKLAGEITHQMKEALFTDLLQNGKAGTSPMQRFLAGFGHDMTPYVLPLEDDVILVSKDEFSKILGKAWWSCVDSLAELEKYRARLGVPIPERLTA